LTYTLAKNFKPVSVSILKLWSLGGKKPGFSLCIFLGMGI